MGNTGKSPDTALWQGLPQAHHLQPTRPPVTVTEAPCPSEEGPFQAALFPRWDRLLSRWPLPGAAPAVPVTQQVHRRGNEAQCPALIHWLALLSQQLPPRGSVADPMGTPSPTSSLRELRLRQMGPNLHGQGQGAGAGGQQMACNHRNHPSPAVADWGWTSLSPALGPCTRQPNSCPRLLSWCLEGRHWLGQVEAQIGTFWKTSWGCSLM